MKRGYDIMLVRMSKSLALAIILILVGSSLILTESAFASIPKPSIPEFTLKIVDNSYDVPTTYSIDPYTGANVTNPAKHIDNRTLKFTIKNQPFTPYYDASSSFNVTLYYNIRMKGHYEENWTNLYFIDDNHPKQSNSDYTVIIFLLGANGDNALRWLPPKAEVDFQVEAMIGFFSRLYNPNATNQLEMFPWGFTGAESGWSNTQTIAIDESTPTASSSTTATPSIPEFSLISAIFLLVVASVSLVYFKRRKGKL
jgi:hypothetical protein